ncbi:hypothetical protein PENTCL1PPCAC_19673, partial [Pristionchus entomophagus]
FLQMLPLRILLSSLLLISSTQSSPTPLFEKAKSLVLISFDGFRFDTLNSTIAPNITAWAEGGVVFSKGIQSQAVTFTAPNHYSIVTGLYEDAHGIIGNVFFDVERRKFWDIYNLSHLAGTVEEAQKPYWYTSETIWQSNQKAGGKSSVVHWPIGDVASGNDEATTFHIWLPMNRSHHTRFIQVEIVINALQKGENLVAWYISEPDHTLHTHGFYHDGHYRRIMADLDVTFGYFLNRLNELNLFSSTDIIFTADHGHAEVRSLDLVLCIDEHINGTIGVDYQVSDHTILAYTAEQALEIYESLNAAVAEKKIPVRVMWTKDVPASWHFSHPSRLGQVMVVPEIGADARFICPWKDPSTFHSSTHGHAPDNEEMRAVLAMRGPSFSEKREISSIPQNIDLFPLMGKILGIPLPANNGTLERVEIALRPLPTPSAEELPLDSNISTAISIFLIVMPIIVLVIILYYIIMRIKRGPNKQLAHLTAEATEPML